MKINEEIARSHQTVDNDPIQYDEHENVNVEMYANDAGMWSVKVTCTDNPDYSFPVKKFPDEASANFYARQCCDTIVRKTMNENLIRRLIRNILEEGLADDLAKVSSGREAKQVFAKYVDQEEFKKGMLVHWVGSTSALKKVLANPRTKDELSCNYYRYGEDGGGRAHRDWMVRGPKKPIGIIVEGHVTYAGDENMFTGYAKRPRKKAEKAAYDHRKASSGINKYPYHMWQDSEDYLEHLRNPDVPQTKSSEMEPYGVKRDLGDDAWMGSFGSSRRQYQDWNEVLVDNWKIVGIAYGGVGMYGLSERMVSTIKKIAGEYGLRAIKLGKMI